MALNATAIIGAARDDALASGYFESVNGHEPKSAPIRQGLSAAIWVESIKPARSGLSSTSALLTLNVRIYTSMLSEPQDAIDPALCDAVSALMSAYAGGFTLGGLVANIDLLGSQGSALEAIAGYIHQDGKVYRIMTITLPAIVNDAWDQAA